MSGGPEHPELNEPFDPDLVEVRPAATVMLIRDASDVADIEVFMMRRTTGAVFGPGFYVFPGGRVDPGDVDDRLGGVCDGLTDRSASKQLGVARGGLGSWMAAIRECFEEAGVLLAERADGTQLRFDDARLSRLFETYRRDIHEGRVSLVDICHRENLRLSAGSIRYVSHWVTPPGDRRRFDTRIFLAVAPALQPPLHDDQETIASEWMTPSEALRREAAGGLLMMPPTISSLRFLSRSSTTAAALGAADRLTARERGPHR